MKVILTLGVALWLALVTIVSAQTSVSETDVELDRFNSLAEQSEAALDAGRADDGVLDAFRADLEKFRKELTEAAELTQTKVAPLHEQLAPLVPEGGGETTDPVEAAERARLEREIDALESSLRRLRQAIARATALTDRLNRERRERFTQTLLERGPSPVVPENAVGMWRSLTFKLRVLRREAAVRMQSGAAGFDPDRVALPIFLALVALLLGVGLRRWLVGRLLSALGDTPSDARKAGIGAGVTLARLVVPLLSIGLIYFGMTASNLVGPVLEKLFTYILQGAAVMIAAYAMSGAYFAPGARGLRLSSLDDKQAARAHRWLMLVASVLLLDRILVIGGREIGLNTDALATMNAGLLVLGGLSLVLFVKHARLGLPEKTREELAAESEDGVVPPATLAEKVARTARLVARVISVVAPVLALIGYFGASRFVFYPPVLSGALICLCILIYDVVAFGSRSAQSARSAGMGADTASADAGPSPFGVIPVFVGFLLVLAALPLLAIVWGADTTDLEAVWARVLEGFEIGDVRLSPIDFMLSIIVFMIGYMLTRGVQGVLRRSVLPLTRMDLGAQSAVIAGIGYVGITIAALVAISTTGLDLSNIAIVAGALSVGIGFGLQNIVNNFVSGIILLIERPIKSGDWVEIGGVHGTVQQVNVRSTEIQTFDRSTMFVPNADLISGTVTNWTHGNAMGRLIVPVGVAYGTDARRVEKILLEIARAHPSLLRRPEPYVVFSGFGADSIDFEIRGVLRDVNWILNVASDIRYSIYERFAEEEIEIPFAQRDVFIKNIDRLGSGET